MRLDRIVSAESSAAITTLNTMIAEIEFIPVPADESLYNEDTQYLAMDANGQFHTAKWNGETLLLDGTEDAEAEEVEDVDIVLIGILPDLDVPDSI